MRPGHLQVLPQSPAARFEAGMDPRARRQAGAHYTSERDILRVIEPLFLEDLRGELRAATRDGAPALRGLLARLAGLRFLDPACGCGDFLVVTLRELRGLEREALLALREHRGALEGLARVGCAQLVGIELDAVAAGIAREALVQVDAELDAAATALGLPARAAGQRPEIRVANALRADWRELLAPEQCAYVLGNPPFVGKKEQSPQQKADMALVWRGVRGAGVLDLASCWFVLAARYIAGTHARVGFVATSSIAQGEQVAALWGELLAHPGLNLQFAVRGFPWGGAARGRAQVHVVVIGFGDRPVERRRIFEHVAGVDHPTVTSVREISPYLVAGGPTLVRARRRPISAVPELVYGSFALDGGHYTLDAAQRAALLAECPGAAGFVRRFVGGRELLRGEPRYCLWLADADPSELAGLTAVTRRVAAVGAWRRGRGRALTRALAATPTRFAEVRQPEATYLAIPTTSSERRRYLPIAFLGPEVIASNQLYILPGAGCYEFGVLHSAMHMAWARQVCGRLKSDLRYSNAIVYNNFPWPEAAGGQRAAVESAAAEVLAARAAVPGATLSMLYEPTRMPAALGAAHQRLDDAVDRCYGAAGPVGERARVELLFALYERATAATRRA
jgi:hypothetical protein